LATVPHGCSRGGPRSKTIANRLALSRSHS